MLAFALETRLAQRHGVPGRHQVTWCRGLVVSETELAPTVSESRHVFVARHLTTVVEILLCTIPHDIWVRPSRSMNIYAHGDVANSSDFWRDDRSVSNRAHGGAPTSGDLARRLILHDMWVRPNFETHQTRIPCDIWSRLNFETHHTWIHYNIRVGLASLEIGKHAVLGNWSLRTASYERWFHRVCRSALR